MHSADAEHLLLGLEGQLIWNVAGVRYTMNPKDLLFVGAGMEYEYWNSGFTTAQFIDVIGRVDAWPSSGNYTL